MSDSKTCFTCKHFVPASPPRQEVGRDPAYTGSFTFSIAPERGMCRCQPLPMQIHVDDHWCGQWRPQSDSAAGIYADFLEERGCPPKWTELLRKEF